MRATKASRKIAPAESTASTAGEKLTAARFRSSAGAMAGGELAVMERRMALREVGPDSSAASAPRAPVPGQPPGATVSILANALKRPADMDGLFASWVQSDAPQPR